MKAKIDVHGTLLIIMDPISGDADNYALLKWVEDWKKGLGCVSIRYEGAGGMTYNQAITPSNSNSKEESTFE